MRFLWNRDLLVSESHIFVWQVVLKVTTPTDWGVGSSSGGADSSAIKQESWYPGRDSFAQVSGLSAPQSTPRLRTPTLFCQACLHYIRAFSRHRVALYYIVCIIVRMQVFA